MSLLRYGEAVEKVTIHFKLWVTGPPWQHKRLHLYILLKLLFPFHSSKNKYTQLVSVSLAGLETNLTWSLSGVTIFIKKQILLAIVTGKDLHLNCLRNLYIHGHCEVWIVVSVHPIKTYSINVMESIYCEETM